MSWMDQCFKGSLEALCAGLEKTAQDALPALKRLASHYMDAYRSGGKLICFGNGGSAADAQHIAAELVNRFRLERRPLPAIALTTDTSILTAIGNDYAFRDVFKRQVEALCTEKDVVLGISTSGTSANVIDALQAARDRGAFTSLLSGRGGERFRDRFHLVIAVDSEDTPRTQEIHLFLEHMFCEFVERGLFGGN